MRSRIIRCFSFCSIILSAVSASAQEQPIGKWRAHLPYNQAQGVASDGISLFTISPKGFFTYHAAKSETETFSKVEGMHESSTAVVGYDRSSRTCIIGYSNSNIDLYRDHSFKVLPDLKDKSFSGSKSINSIYTSLGFAYLSTGLGIVVIDLNKQEVKETYVFSKNGQTITINAFTGDDTYFYAATESGLYRIARNHPSPQVFSEWDVLEPNKSYRHVSTVGNNRVYVANSADSIFRVQNGVLSFAVYRDSSTIRHMDGGKEKLYIGLTYDKTGIGWVYELSENNTMLDSVRLGYPMGTVETDDGKTWYADLYQGLGRRDNPGDGLNFIVPPGPNAPTNQDLYARNGEVWTAHGGLNDFNGPLNSRSGMSRFQNGTWTIYKQDNYPLFKDSVFDILHINKNLGDGTVYAGTFNSGLIALKSDNSGSIYKQGAIEFASAVDGYPATSSAFDRYGNLWVTQAFLQNELAMRTPQGVWYHYPVLIPRAARMGLDLTIDDYDQKWYLSASGHGVIVYNDNGTPENAADDPQPRQLLQGQGRGNLPSSAVRCLAKDRDGAIWIGTDDGIGIVNCPYGVIDGSCEAERRIVQYDQFAGYLFAGQVVRAIAVDGGNRKWVGTSNGVWLLTPDASQVLNRFNVENSPLPSNLIQSITVDVITGDVYFGTDQGLVSYRGTATEGDPDNSASIEVFPNPVQAGYSGPIAIRGLVTDADVRITDIAGQLIYKAKASGGQLVWNGLDYTGHRPQSGVLLIFVSDRDGSQKKVGKMVMMH